VLGQTLSLPLPLPLSYLLCAIIIIYFFLTGWQHELDYTETHQHLDCLVVSVFYLLESGVVCSFRSLGCLCCRQKHVSYLTLAYPLDFLSLICLSVHIIINRIDYIVHLLLLLLLLLFFLSMVVPGSSQWKSVQIFSFLAYVAKTYRPPPTCELFIRLNWPSFERQSIEIETWRKVHNFGCF